MNRIVRCATFSKSLNPQNIDKSISDIRIRIRFPFESSFWISLSGCKLTILPDIQPANRIVIISDIHIQSLSKISEIEYLISIHIRMRHWLITKHTGSGYLSTSGPSFLKTYSSVASSMTLSHGMCGVDCTTLGRNVVNLNLIFKPKP